MLNRYKFAGVNRCWRCWRLQSGIVGRGFDIYSCLGVKGLRGALDIGCREKRPGPQRRPQPRQRGGKLLAGARRVRGNPFILVNNVFADCWTIIMNAIFHSKWELDVGCRKNRPGPGRRPQPWQMGGKLPAGVRRVRGNPFILVNNVFADC